ncbi:MAG: hypothetical protein IH841_05610 [Thaumarchaeota archaeon]|nr:hypothetical protein [Nitrososphaerota archaeon]
MEEGEKRLKQEDCSEDELGAGILTLTNKRLAFDKTRGRIMDFSKKMGETVVNVPLSDVKEVWKEGRFMKKVCFTAKTSEGEKTYKFGVLGTGGWLKEIQNAVDDFKNQ